MTQETGGPAFPDPGRAQSAKQRELLTDTGMTLRDYFAAKVLAAYIQADIEGAASRPDAAAQWAYESADAMLKARKP